VESDRLTAAQILAIWDAGAGRPPGEQALATLAIAGGEDPQTVLDLSLAERERRLWKLCRSTFGRQLRAIIRCPHCDDRNEIRFDLDALLAGAVTPPAEGSATYSFSHEDWDIRFRLPTTRELLAPDLEPSAVAARCLQEASRGSEIWQPSEPLPESLQSALDAAILTCAPLVEVQFTIRCAECGQDWVEPFAVAPYLWEAIAAEGRRLLREVHQLARAYAWGEEQILALSPNRRRAYLELIEG
jgi:hypothetical protein